MITTTAIVITVPAAAPTMIHVYHGIPVGHTTKNVIIECPLMEKL